MVTGKGVDPAQNYMLSTVINPALETFSNEGDFERWHPARFK
jgi:hypothetical protein